MRTVTVESVGDENSYVDCGKSNKTISMQSKGILKSSSRSSGREVESEKEKVKHVKIVEQKTGYELSNNEEVKSQTFVDEKALNERTSHDTDAKLFKSGDIKLI